MPKNFEFKARSSRNRELEERLQSLQPQFAGTDHQTDTYFNVMHGRLKLREGTIENALIHYHRVDVEGAKTSEVLLYQHQPDKKLKEALVAALGVKAVVKKIRKIWFVDNVKIHFDDVPGLGSFVEVEAIDNDGTMSTEALQNQSAEIATLFEIKQEDFVAQSYSDLMMEQKKASIISIGNGFPNL